MKNSELIEHIEDLVAVVERQREVLKTVRNCQLPAWVMKVIDETLGEPTPQSAGTTQPTEGREL
jgi:hypothetical protein